MMNKENIKEAIEWLESIDKKYIHGGDEWYDEQRHEAIKTAIKALKHEAYWDDVKQALNNWLNNFSSKQTALNDIYRAYVRKEEEK